MGGKKAVEGHKLANAQISKLFFTISYKITQIELGSILKKRSVYQKVQSKTEKDRNLSVLCGKIHIKSLVFYFVKKNAMSRNFEL